MGFIFNHRRSRVERCRAPRFPLPARAIKMQASNDTMNKSQGSEVEPLDFSFL